ncbi:MULTISPECIES: HAMP domain-containing sensor histidine kinase [unclassified Lentimonas]|uniref:sensor histidine kinase n=1 Tax=unclassified Lentimonas TaxID=2630993 RepID=UPI0013271DA6|nr:MULTISPECIES: PAS domain-containing sensor histidine kinase [unclassified Lentimonas]CAA6678256.1 Signal transduction histidine kinase [Lentimonas sp. CC4]CAA6684848.1 Signal transduction histidine kinase [Lentimonas sp. CC6]CAA7076797.1 Signal transduction histidine kinase [Lentimonas sp. CC4]CAA7170805.1 Signal transduction histidine kinase [Lentimonas sp. CC21]CAA7179633.1 Signal transduction histidine kinase [Lentimonas sp. CC8]
MTPKKTYFAPAERADEAILKAQVSFFENQEDQRSFGDSIPLIFLILNMNRQIVYANHRILEALGEQEFACILGKRMGEVFHCVHATEEAGGCGTSRHCENCGALNAVLQAQKGTQAVTECRLTMEGELSADYRVWATPHEANGQEFTYFTLQDIQHEKRRKALEYTFFHDLMNTAGGISGLTEILSDIDDENEKEEIFDLLDKSAHRLIEEIHSGRALSMAENGDLKLTLRDFNLAELLTDSISAYKNHTAALGKYIQLTAIDEDLHIVSDRAILGRVIGNLIKNALEASESGGCVTVGFTTEEDSVTIKVNNTTVIPPSVKAQMFQRSFSTKGEGRGIGTYSIKLFTKYLKGQVSFTSDETSGTNFYIKLKKQIK